MSHLHKRIKAHQHMTLKEKENCQCEMCKELGTKVKQKIHPLISKKDLPKQKTKDSKRNAKFK